MREGVKEGGKGGREKGKREGEEVRGRGRERMYIVLFSSTDVVTRTTYYKYLHPKEAFVSNGVLNRLHSPSLPPPLSLPLPPSLSTHTD